MEPEKYLPKEAKAIFKRIVKHLDENAATLPIDSIELSMLSMAYYQFEQAAIEGLAKGFVNDYSTEEKVSIQVNGYQSVMNSAYSNILKHSSKFGLNPGDREKLDLFKNKEPGLPKLVEE